MAFVRGFAVAVADTCTTPAGVGVLGIVAIVGIATPVLNPPWPEQWIGLIGSQFRATLYPSR